jgi:hypothetical protein
MLALQRDPDTDISSRGRVQPEGLMNGPLVVARHPIHPLLDSAEVPQTGDPDFDFRQVDLWCDRVHLRHSLGPSDGARAGEHVNRRHPE